MQSYDEKHLWPVFSEFIRLRDIIPGMPELLVRCVTCRKFVPWKRAHAGHGVSRKHQMTKYNEQNVHAQCLSCNIFLNGNPIAYKEQMDKLYGSQTWDKMEAAAKQLCKRTKSEWDLMIFYYKEQVRLLKLKHHIK